MGSANKSYADRKTSLVADSNKQNKTKPILYDGLGKSTSKRSETYFQQRKNDNNNNKEQQKNDTSPPSQNNHFNHQVYFLSLQINDSESCLRLRQSSRR